MRNIPRIRRSSGFTLIELIIVIVLLGLLAAVGSNMISDSFTTSRMVNADTASKQQARYALERLAREIREVKYDTTNSRHCITSLASPTNLAFNKTSGAYDSTCATNAITVTINKNAAEVNLTLLYSPATVSSTLSNQVSGFSLVYLDASGTATTSTSAVRFVVITLAVTDAISGQSISQRTRVALRNQ